MRRGRLSAIALTMTVSLGVGGVVACSQAELTNASIDSLALSDGRLLRDILGSTAPAAVLVLDPISCLVCDPLMAEWILAYQRSVPRVQLVFCRAPTEPERRRLLASRIRSAGVVELSACAKRSEFAQLVFLPPDGRADVVPIRESRAVLRMMLDSTPKRADDAPKNTIEEVSP